MRYTSPGYRVLNGHLARPAAYRGCHSCRTGTRSSRPGTRRHDLRRVRGENRKVLNRVPSAQAAVNFATESATVSFDAAQSEPWDLIAAVEARGLWRAASSRRTPKASDARTKRAKDRCIARPDARILDRRGADGAFACTDVADAIARNDRTPARTCRHGCRAGCSSRWPPPSNSGPVGAFMSVPGMHCAAAAPAWTCSIVLGTTIAWAWSAAVMLTRTRALSRVLRERPPPVITLVLLGRLLEARAKAGTSAAMTEPLEITAARCACRARRQD